MKLSSGRSSSNGVAGVWWVWIPLLLWLLCTSTAWASPIVVENDGMIISSSLSSSTSSSSSSSSLTPHQRRELFDPVNSKPLFSPFFSIFLHSSLSFIYISLSLARSVALAHPLTTFSFFPPLLLNLSSYIYILYIPTRKKNFRNNQKYPATPVQEVLIHSIRT